MNIDELPEGVQERIQINQSDGRRQIVIRWKPHWPFLLLCFGIPSALLFWIIRYENGPLFMASLVLISLPFIWIGLSNVLNSTTIVKEDHTITVRHHPIFRLGADAERVRKVQIVEYERQGTEGYMVTMLRFYAQTTDNHMRNLRMHQLEEPVLRWLEQELNRSSFS
jgi:hypothetical protein